MKFYLSKFKMAATFGTTSYILYTILKNFSRISLYPGRNCSTL